MSVLNVSTPGSTPKGIELFSGLGIMVACVETLDDCIRAHTYNPAKLLIVGEDLVVDTSFFPPDDLLTAETLRSLFEPLTTLQARLGCDSNSLKIGIAIQEGSPLLSACAQAAGPPEGCFYIHQPITEDMVLELLEHVI